MATDFSPFIATVVHSTNNSYCPFPKHSFQRSISRNEDRFETTHRHTGHAWQEAEQVSNGLGRTRSEESSAPVAIRLNRPASVVRADGPFAGRNGLFPDQRQSHSTYSLMSNRSLPPPSATSRHQPAGSIQHRHC